MNKVNLILLVAVLLGSSCTRTDAENNTVEVLNFQLENPSDCIDLSEIASDVRSIPLQTNDSTVLDQIVRIVHKEDMIYVADKEGVYKYNDQGVLQHTLFKKGGGPDEYVNLSDFQIDEDGGLWILSRSGRCLYKYTWEGVVERKIQLKCWATKICLLGNDEMLLYIGNEKDEDNDVQLALLNLETQQLTKGYLPIDDKKSAYLHINSSNHFSREDDNLYFFQLFNDTVYRVSSTNQLIPSYYLNLGKKNIPISFFDNEYHDVMDFFNHLNSYKYAYGTNLFMKSEGSFWIFSNYDGKRYFSVLKDGESRSATKWQDDVCYIGYQIDLTDLSVFPQQNGELIAVIWPFDLLNHADEKMNESQKDKLKERLGELEVEQNPILLLLKMK